MRACVRPAWLPAFALGVVMMFAGPADAQSGKRLYAYEASVETPQAFVDLPRRRLPQTLFEAIQRAREDQEPVRRRVQTGDRAEPRQRAASTDRAERQARRERREQLVAIDPAPVASIQNSVQTAATTGGLFSVFAPVTSSVETLPINAEPARPPALSLTVNPLHRRVERKELETQRFNIGANRVAYCVRLCDGRYFPLTNAAEESDETPLCNAMCPGSPTQVFVSTDGSGSIDAAIGGEGRHRGPYSRLSTAFSFREKVAPSCSCHARGYGMTPVDLSNDPTLRPGDIVATATGLKTFRGARVRPYRPRDFVDVSRYENFSRALRRQLSMLKVTQEPPEAPLF